VKEAVHERLRNQRKVLFFSNGIKKHWDRRAKCIEKKSHYIENLCSNVCNTNKDKKK
jgi:hypothetical protein